MTGDKDECLAYSCALLWCLLHTLVLDNANDKGMLKNFGVVWLGHNVSYCLSLLTLHIN